MNTSGIGDGEFLSFLRNSVLPIKPSQYDITSVCNLDCDGCLFFAGDEYKSHPDTKDIGLVDRFFCSERQRGVNYVYIAGAEPSLSEDKLLVASRYFSRGVVATNGIKKISNEVPFRIHLSVWGNAGESARLRGADIFDKQMRNYAGDRRAVFVFSINSQNMNSMMGIAAGCADRGAKLTFNYFSSPINDQRNQLRLSQDDMRLATDNIELCMGKFPDAVIYDLDYARWVAGGDIYRIDDGLAVDCPSKRGGALKHFLPDLTESSAKCCSPNIDCSDCKLYIQTMAAAIRHPGRGGSGLSMRGWLGAWRLWCRLFLPE